MKKISVFLSSLILAASMLPTNAGAVPANPKGDANGDMQVTVSDAVCIMQAIANPNKYDIYCPVCADVDDNPGITLLDAWTIRAYLTGIIDEFPFNGYERPREWNAEAIIRDSDNIFNLEDAEIEFSSDGTIMIFAENNYSVTIRGAYVSNPNLDGRVKADAVFELDRYSSEYNNETVMEFYVPETGTVKVSSMENNITVQVPGSKTQSFCTNDWNCGSTSYLIAHDGYYARITINDNCRKVIYNYFNSEMPPENNK